MSSKAAIIGSDFPMVRNIVEDAESGLFSRSYITWV